MALPTTAPPPRTNPIAPTPPTVVNPAANGVSWTMPAPEAIPNVPSDTGGQIADALSQAPLNYSNQQAQLAQNQTNQELAKSQAIVADDQILQRILPSLRNNQQLANSPALLSMLAPILARRGLQIPKDPATGQVDAARLIAMITPAPTMTPTAEAAMYKGLDTEELALGKGQGSPAVFLDHVKRVRAELAAAGMSTASVDTYLTPDGQGLDPNIIANYVGPKVEADMSHLHDLGVNMANEDKWREALARERAREFDTTTKYRYAALSVREQQVSNQMQVAQQRIGIANQNLTARWASIQNAQNTYRLNTNKFNLDVYKTKLTAADTTMKNAQDELAKDVQLLGTLMALPNAASNPTVVGRLKDLNDQMYTLKQQIQEIQPHMADAHNEAANGIGHITSNITGNPSAVIPPKSIDVNRLPAGTLYSKTHRQYKTPDGHIYDAQGKLIQ